MRKDITYRLGPVDEGQPRLSALFTPSLRIQRVLRAREMTVGLIRGRLRRPYLDLPSRELNRKGSEEIDRAQRTAHRPGVNSSDLILDPSRFLRATFIPS
jgi:hypothetical protein